MRPEICPNCGEEVPAKAKACPECGACEEAGWSEDAGADLGLPDEDFNYDEFVKREFEGKSPQPKNRKLWVIAAILLLAAFAWAFLGHGLRR